MASSICIFLICCGGQFKDLPRSRAFYAEPSSYMQVHNNVVILSPLAHTSLDDLVGQLTGHARRFLRRSYRARRLPTPWAFSALAQEWSGTHRPKPCVITMTPNPTLYYHNAFDERNSICRQRAGGTY